MSEHTPTPGNAAPERMWLKALPALVVLLVVVATLSFLLVKSPAKPTLPGGAQQSLAGEGFYGTLALPAEQAPAIHLRNYLGQSVTLSQYRGKAVLVTFLYANCPDICPLIASNLRVALNMLGRRASRVQVIAVSVDPRGDTAANVARFVREHEMVGRMQYLIGSAPELAPTWAAWHVGSQREAGQPGLVAHSALVYGITASGVLKTVYPATFEPSELAHDVPKLAAQ
jgi:protein SCO1/2